MPPRTKSTQSATAVVTKATAAKPAAKKAATKEAPAKAAPTKAAAAKAPAEKSAAAKKAATKAAPQKTPANPSAPAHKAAAKAAPQKATVAKATAHKAAAPAKKAAPSSRAKSEYMADTKFIERQKTALVAERETYTEQARSLQAEAEALVLEMEPGDIQFDDESGEGGTVTVDRERDLALSAQALAAVEEIDEALGKIKSGRYGVCEGCGQLIAKARLEALPFAKLCIGCKSGGLSRR